MSLKHRRVVTVADDPSAVAAGKLCPSHWGSSSTNYTTAPTHEFTGGALGSLLYRDTGTPLEGVSWLASAQGVLTCSGAGTVPAFSMTPSLTSLALSTPLPATSGGTGFASFVIGDLLYASATNALSRLASVAVGSVLVPGGVGVAPAWSATPSLTSLTLSTSLSLGASPSSAGAIRLSNNTQISGRNAGNNGDVELLKIAASDVATFGGLLQSNTSNTLTALAKLFFSPHNSLDIGSSPSTSAPRNIFVGGAMCQRTKAGTPTDSDVTNPTDGMMVVDTSASKIWVRVGGTWKSVAVA